MRLFFERVWGWLLENIGRGLNIFFHYGLSQGVSKIGPTHHFTLLFDPVEYRETSSEIRRICPKDRIFFKPTLSAQEADNVGFHPEKRIVWEILSQNCQAPRLSINQLCTPFFLKFFHGREDAEQKLKK
jgi:hypothetical protein